MGTFLGYKGEETSISENNTEINLTANVLATLGRLSLYLIEAISLVDKLL